MSVVPPRTRSPQTFFLIVIALCIPFWLAGASTARQLLPGLPVSALSFLCPAAAALILVYGESKTAGMIALLKRSFDYQRIRGMVWYAPIILLGPGVMACSYGLMRLTGVPIPAPRFTVLTALALLLVFFVGALGEELGWSGYAIDAMQAGWNALGASMLLGLAWAGFHIIPLLEARRPPTWIAWWCVGTVAARVLLVWLYNNTGKSVFAVTLCHAMQNLSWMLFPIYGSYYDPRITGLITACAAAIVIAVWGPRTLARRWGVDQQPAIGA